MEELFRILVFAVAIGVFLFNQANRKKQAGKDVPASQPPRSSSPSRDSEGDDEEPVTPYPQQSGNAPAGALEVLLQEFAGAFGGPEKARRIARERTSAPGRAATIAEADATSRKRKSEADRDRARRLQQDPTRRSRFDHGGSTPTYKRAAATPYHESDPSSTFPSPLSAFTAENLRMGIIWKEVLGKPKALLEE